MSKKNNKPKDLTKKLKVYKEKGEPSSRRVFEAEIPEYIQVSKHKPYGRIFLYDDMTENDVVEIFRQYKKTRNKWLKQQDITTRKHITKNIDRDIQWVNMVKKYKSAVNYVKIAQQWAKRNPQEIFGMVLTGLWKKPEKTMDPKLSKIIKKAQSKGKIFDSFIQENKRILFFESMKSDINEYVNVSLPQLIRSAVTRSSKIK